MLRTLPQTRDSSTLYRAAGIAVFVAISVICAKITIPVEPVPFTLQTLAVLLAGMVLGARDGALSQIAYLALIAVGLPVDAFGRGAAALFGPTGGYLIGFVAAAAVVGLLTERSTGHPWLRWLAGLAGVITIHLFGLPVLALTRAIDLNAAWTLGTAPFIVSDLLKMALAVSLAESGRALLRNGSSGQ